jgi:hypothetical protein
MGDFTAPMRQEELDDSYSGMKTMGAFDVMGFVKENSVSLIALAVLGIGIYSMSDDKPKISQNPTSELNRRQKKKIKKLWKKYEEEEASKK